MKVSIQVKDNRVVLSAPYHPDLPKAAREIDGKFDGQTKNWTFDQRDISRVREMALGIYGEDGYSEPILVDIRETIVGNRDTDGRELWKYGRQILSRRSRDANVELGDGVILVDGAFRPSGGSARYPSIMNSNHPDVMLEIRDVPICLVNKSEVEIVSKHEEPNPLASFSTEDLLEEIERRNESTNQ